VIIINGKQLFIDDYIIGEFKGAEDDVELK